MPFRNPIVAGEELVIPGIRSDDFEELVRGWRIARNGFAQFNNLQILGDLGTTGRISGPEVYADQFVVGPGGILLPDGSNLLDKVATPYPGEIVSWYEYPVSSSNFTGITWEMFIASVTVTAPHDGYYAVFTENVRMSSTVSTDEVATLLRGKAGTVRPINTDTLYDFSGDLRPNGAIVAPRLWRMVYLAAGSTFTFGMFARRTNGTGDVTLYTATNSASTPRLFVQYVAPPTLTKRGTAGSEPEAAPAPKTYTKTYYPTWSRTYDGDGTTTWDDSAYCYQGYYSSSRGNTRSLVGYDYSQIMSDLSGASNITVKLTYKIAHSYYNAGMTVVVGGHTYTSKPSTWATANVGENQVQDASAVAGSTYTLTLPSAFATNLKSGAWKGIAFGPGPSTDKVYYGYLYGATQSGKPYLTITYTK